MASRGTLPSQICNLTYIDAGLVCVLGDEPVITIVSPPS